ncbi:MAG: molybdenum cofactor biosynthesis protein B [Acidobacteriota bacterium]
MKAAAVITVSDGCARGLRPDLSGSALSKMLASEGFSVVHTCTVPDEIALIREAVCRWSRPDVRLIVTTGGTGIAPRDVTPEAIRPLLEKEMPGLGELMRLRGLEDTAAAAISRSLAGVLNRTLVLCLPGSVKGATQSLAAVAKLIPHILDLLSGATEHSRSEDAGGLDPAG